MNTTQRNCKHCGSLMICRTARKLFCGELCRVNHHHKTSLLTAVEFVMNKENKHGDNDKQPRV